MNYYTIILNYIPSDFERLVIKLKKNFNITIDSLISKNSNELVLLTYDDLDSTGLSNIVNYINNVYDNKNVLYESGEFYKNMVSRSLNVYNIVAIKKLSTNADYIFTGCQFDINSTVDDNFTGDSVFARLYNKNEHVTLKDTSVSMNNDNISSTITCRIELDEFITNSNDIIELQIKKGTSIEKIILSNLNWEINK